MSRSISIPKWIPGVGTVYVPMCMADTPSKNGTTPPANTQFTRVMVGVRSADRS